MDHHARQMFQALPEDLRIRGWANARQESTIHRLAGVEWYAIVFQRPFEPGVDDETLSSAGRNNRSHVVRVSTDSLRSCSWDEAFQDAIGLMRQADEPRAAFVKTVEPGP